DIPVRVARWWARVDRVAYVVLSTPAAWKIWWFLWLGNHHAGPRVVSPQIPFSLLRREFQHDLAFCRRHAVGVTPYQVLQGGLLTGKYRRGQPPPTDSRAAQKPDWMWKFEDTVFDRVEGVEVLAREAGIPASR